MPAGIMRNRLLRGAVHLVFLVGLLEGSSWLAIAVISPRLDEPIRRTQVIFREQSERIQHMLDSLPAALLTVPDGTLGWRHRPGYRSASKTISSQGLRGAREYAAEPPAGTLRAVAFGDSYVFGAMVNDSSAWPAVVERTFPGIEVPNYGVSGYGLDQTYLALLARGKELHPQVVIVGIVPPGLGRVVSIYLRFLSSLEQPLAKPRFLLSDSGVLTLVPNPLPGEQDYRRILRHPRDVLAYGRLDDWYTPLVYANPLYDYSATVRLVTALWIRISRRYFARNRLYVGPYVNPNADAFKIHVALFERMADSIKQWGATPMLVFFPDPYALARTMRGLPPPYQPLLDTLRAHGLKPLDAASAFPATRPRDVGRWFAYGHFSVQGNQVVALWLGRMLAERRPAPSYRARHASTASRIRAAAAPVP